MPSLNEWIKRIDEHGGGIRSDSNLKPGKIVYENIYADFSALATSTPEEIKKLKETRDKIVHDMKKDGWEVTVSGKEFFDNRKWVSYTLSATRVKQKRN